MGVADDNPTALMKFINDKKIDYPVVLEGSIEKIMPKWGVNAIPTTFIQNNNKLLFRNVGLMTKDLLASAIEKALNSKISRPIYKAYYIYKYFLIFR